MASSYFVNGLPVPDEASTYPFAAELLLAGSELVDVEVIHSGPSLWDSAGSHSGRRRLLQSFQPKVQTVVPGSCWTTDTFPRWFWRQLDPATQSALQSLS